MDETSQEIEPQVPRRRRRPRLIIIIGTLILIASLIGSSIIYTHLGSPKVRVTRLPGGIYVPYLQSRANTGQDGTGITDLQNRATLTPSRTVTPSPVAPASTRGNGPMDGYGLYENCIISDATCLDHLRIMGNAGFRLVLNYNQMYGTVADEMKYAQAATSYGIKIIWGMGDMPAGYNKDLRALYPDLSASCNCTDNAGFIRYAVNLVKNFPATWGYYVADETPTSEHAQVKTIADIVHQADPNHPRLIVLGSDGPYVNDGLKTFADSADVLAQDYYPVGDPNESIDATGTVAQQVQSLSAGYGRQSGMVLQIHSLGQYDSYKNYCNPFPSCLPYPTTDQMRTMRTLTMQAAHPRIVLWYSYFDLVNSDNYAKHWSDVAAAMK